MSILRIDYHTDHSFLQNVAPIKITEAIHLPLNSNTWGLLTEYYLESVKVNFQFGKIDSTATLRVGDISGQTICLVKGSTIGLLFGLSRHQWTEIESLSKRNGQLFYRYFKDGLNSSFSYEQKLFYYFCASNQQKDVLVALFKRCPNLRKRDRSDAFLQVTELRKLDTKILDLYQSYLQQKQPIL